MWVRIRNNSQDDQFELATGALELGRSAQRTDGPHFQIQDGRVSRRQLLAETAGVAKTKLTNLSPTVPVVFSDGRRLQSGDCGEFILPLRMYVGDTCIEMQTQKPGIAARPVRKPERAPLSLATLNQFDNAPGSDMLMEWFVTLVVLLRSAVDAESFYAESARALHEHFGIDCGLVLMRGVDGWSVEAAYPDGAGEFSSTVLQQMAELGQTVLETFESQGELSASLMGVQAAVASPIFDEKGELVAALYGARRCGVQQLTSQDVIRPIELQMVQLLATAVESGIARLEARAKMERIQTEMQLARRIQQGLFPRKMPAVCGYEFAGRTEPSALTGGDYYDAIPLSDGRLGLVIADVCGHGFGPSLLMASMRATLRGLAVRAHEPGQLVTDLNLAIYDELSRRMITLQYGILDAATHRFQYVNAGHGPAVLHVRSADNSLRLLHEDENRNFPLGAMREVQYETCQDVWLEPGDLIVLGSDGLVETNDGFRLEEFCRLICDFKHAPLAEIIDRAYRSIHDCSAGRRREDDLTMLLVRREA